MTFLLSEDKALRERLQGLKVTDQKAAGETTLRDVGVWFGMPDQELRAQSYPYITIDMIDISQDPSREHRGKATKDNAPYLFADEIISDDEDREIDYPIPVNIDYQVTTFSRHPRHDREILASLLNARLPMRFGIVHLDDNTVRRLDVLGVAKRDLVEQGRRLFMNAITVRISSEIAQGTLKTLYKVLSVELDPPREGWDSIDSYTITQQ
jgi:hypothetical protein